MEDLQKYHGERFRAKIGGVICEGRISVCGRHLYLCQNFKNGFSAPDKLGFAYSWLINVGDSQSIEDAIEYSLLVSDFELLDGSTGIIETTHFLTI